MFWVIKINDLSISYLIYLKMSSIPSINITCWKLLRPSRSPRPKSARKIVRHPYKRLRSTRITSSVWIFLQPTAVSNLPRTPPSNHSITTPHDHGGSPIWKHTSIAVAGTVLLPTAIPLWALLSPRETPLRGTEKTRLSHSLTDSTTTFS